MMKDSMDKMSVAQPAAAAQATIATEQKEEHSIMDKISDLIPGEAGEKIETFAKGAAHSSFEKTKSGFSNVTFFIVTTYRRADAINSSAPAKN